MQLCCHVALEARGAKWMLGTNINAFCQGHVPAGVSRGESVSSPGGNPHSLADGCVALTSASVPLP